MDPLLFLLGGLSLALAGPPRADDALQRGVAWLAREVPRWQQQHGCFSCHHNGDGVRALLAARAGGIDVPDASLADSLAWLARPEEWDDPGEGAPFRDTVLARLQFAAAARDAAAQGALAPDALARASAALVPLQGPEGRWAVDTGGAPGSPITWGPTLATVQARSVLATSAQAGGEAAEEQAREWLVRQRPRRVLDAAAQLLALAEMGAEGPVEEARRHARQVLALARPADGGYGPFQGSPPEVFDTALVVLALAPDASEPSVAAALQAARRHLLLQQDLDGSWPPTTRPSGGASEAHRLSTSAWAVLALLRVAQVLPAD